MQCIKKSVKVRATALLLSLVMLLGLLPLSVPTAQAASWMDPYLNKVVEWGIMRGDINGNLNADRDITRAEFVTMINRAYGYTVPGDNPFRDVSSRNWYYDDIRIAHKVGYFAGTASNRADPEQSLTREQAALMLGRNMMLRQSVGELLGYNDSRSFSDWSRGIIQAVTDAGVVSGYPDGTFRPQSRISRGEVACMLVMALGTPIQTAGSYSLGGVYGNVTITVAGVELKNTTIAGDLYLTGGVGLGDVLLENVTVLGKIIVSGAGESEKGQSSVLLRNTTASEMVVDSINNQFVTVHVDGETAIGTTSIRTSAYVQDNANENYGLSYIEIDGENGIQVQLAGDIQEVRNLTPGSVLTLAQGSAQEITMDEKAVGATLSILSGAWAKLLNLDVGAAVNGAGDINSLLVSAAGAVVSILPDNITIRPGLTASVDGKTMDTVTAAESSENPRLLAGYPTARNIAPATADAVFSTNKSGTIYWAVSALTDGSVGEADLISPPAYSGKILKSGNISVKASKTEMIAKLTGLISDGSYYLSAVLVDERGQRSPVKVSAFTTPDDTVPNFATGYPYMSKITNNSAQVAVMTTKSCQLYYALLPKGSTPPKANEFKANAVTGNLGYGSMEMTKNTAALFTVNSRVLEELQTYDLYLWLTDFNGAKSSAVKKITFTTVDKTPPIVMHMDVTGMKATSVEMAYALNEPGTLYWAVVKEGTDYPKPLNGQSGKPALTEDGAKIQVQSGMNALKNGNSRATKGQTDVKFTISGLEPQTSYDLYYVAVDSAGNYSAAVEVMTINTLDDQPPLVTQEFTKYNGNDTKVPLPNTDIRLVFSESVQGMETVQGERVYTMFMELYQRVQRSTGPEHTLAKEALANHLRKHIQLYVVPVSGQPTLVAERTSSSSPSDPWVIDYRNVTVSMEDGKMVLTFPNSSAITLASGATYYFSFSGIADTSTAANLMGNTTLDRFTTVFAQVSLSQGTTSGTVVGMGTVEFDMSVKVTPISTANVEDAVMWDILLWSTSDIKFELYTRKQGDTDWVKATNSGRILPTAQDLKPGTSVTRKLLGVLFEELNDLTAEREYAINIIELAGNSQRSTWSDSVVVNVDVVAGDRVVLENLAANVSAPNFTVQKGNGAVEIGLPDEYTMQRVFQDSTPPAFTGGYPMFTAGDSGVNIQVQIDRDKAHYYYVVAPVEKIPTRYNGTDIDTTNWNLLPQSGLGITSSGPFANPPTSTNIMNPTYKNVEIKTGNGSYSGGTDVIPVSGLSANTKYVAYIVLKGEAQDTYSQVYCFGFETTDVVRPILTVQLQNPSAKIMADRIAEVSYLLIVVGKENSLLKDTMINHFVSGVNASTQSSYGGLTLLDAMQSEVKASDGVTVLGSVFDLYAAQSTKDQVASLIRTQTGADQNIAMVGSANLAANSWHNVNCLPYMSGTAKYWFVAVGKSPLGSGDAFRASRSLFVPDDRPPKVIAINAATTSRMVETYTEAVARTYTGTLTVTFDEELFYKSSDDVWTPVADKAIPVATDYTSSVALMPSLPSGIVINHAIAPASSPPYPSCYSLTFAYTNITQNTTITFDRNLCDSGGITGSRPLSLTMKLIQKNGIWEPTFQISPSDWDSTGQ